MNVISNGAIYQFIGNATNGTNYTLATLPVSSIGIFDETGTAKETAISTNTTGNFRIVSVNADGTKLFSPYFKTGDLVSAVKADYSAPTEQITYVGATATSGSAVPTVSGLGGTPTVGATYLLRVDQYHANMETTNEGITSSIPYLASSGDTEATLAKGLVDNAQRILVRSVPAQFIKVERVSNGTTTVMVANPVATVTQGSKTVTFNATHAVAGNGTALFIAGATYLVDTVVNTTTLTLDQAYVGSSGNITSANSTAYMTGIGVMVAPTAWGIRFTGIAQTFGKQQAKTGRYEKVRFNVSPINNALAPINIINGSTITYATGFLTTVNATTVQGADEGSGTYESVAVMESFAQFQNKAYQSDPQLSNYKQEATVAGKYQLITLSFQKKDIPSIGTGIATNSAMTIILANTSGTGADYSEFCTVFGL
jgi:hypothetical protein